MTVRMVTTKLCAVTVLSLIALSSPILAQGSQGKADRATSLIEMRFARWTPTPGFQQSTDPQSRRAVYVSGETVFTDSDFVRVRALTRPDALTLSARWTADAAERFADLMGGKLGAGNDIALFIDGELVSVMPVIVDPNATVHVDSDSTVHVMRDVSIGVPLPADRRKHIADAVAVRWPGRDH
jgi:hypothetical protein